jgi:hypothetical protein
LEERVTTNSKILAIAHAWDKARARRLAEQKKVDELAVEERRLKDQLVGAIRATKAKSIGDNDYVYALVPRMEPTPENWPKLYQYIQKTGSFDLLYRRINPAAVKERWEEGVRIPGVSKFPVEELSRTKAKGA